MPPKYSKYTKKSKKMPYKKAKKVVAKAQAKKRGKQQDTQFLRVKFVGELVPVQGTTVTNYLNYWQPLCISAGATSFDWRNASDYTVLKYQYDQVRVNRMKVVLTPKANVFDASNAQNDANLTLIGDGMIHSAIDRDSQTPTNVNALSRYSSYQRKSLLKKVVRSYQVKWPTGVWLDCGNEFGGGADSIVRSIGGFGGIGFYAEDIVEDKFEWYNEPYCQVTVYFDLVLRGKITPNTGLDASGNIILYRPIYTAICDPSPLIQTGGNINGLNRRLVLDASGNLTDLSGVVIDETVCP